MFIEKNYLNQGYKNSRGETNENQILNSFLYEQKVSEQHNGHSSDLDHRKSDFQSVKMVHKVNGTKWRKDDGDF